MHISKILSVFHKPYKILNWIELSQSALDHNYDLFQKLNPRQNIFPVLKSNAYGHGISQIVKMLTKHNPKYLVVDGYFEALEIKKTNKSQKVLIMGAIHSSNYKNLHYKNFSYVVHDFESIEALGKLNKSIKIHLELNTGMNRHGIDTVYLDDYLELIKKYKNLDLEGVMSHLADADNPQDDQYNQRQQNEFDNSITKIKAKGFNPKYFHLSQSAGSTKIKSKFANSFRLGLGLYGINPLSPFDIKFKCLADLKPILSLHSTITKIIDLKIGEKVSYNGIYQAKTDTKIAVIPLGYFEGLDRSLSNIGKLTLVSNNGLTKQNVTIAGRVCMNHTMLDIGNCDAKIGDEIIVYTKDSQSDNTFGNLWKNQNMFAYSSLVHLNHNIRRTIVN